MEVGGLAPRPARRTHWKRAPPVPIDQGAGWVQGSVWMFGGQKILSCVCKYRMLLLLSSVGLWRLGRTLRTTGFHRDFMFWQWCWRFRSSGMWRRVVCNTTTSHTGRLDFYVASEICSCPFFRIYTKLNATFREVNLFPSSSKNVEMWLTCAR
jgi:hypothetical protein